MRSYVVRDAGEDFTQQLKMNKANMVGNVKLFYCCQSQCRFLDQHIVIALPVYELNRELQPRSPI